MTPKDLVRAFHAAFVARDVDALCALDVFQRGYWDKLTFLRAHGLPLPT